MKEKIERIREGNTDIFVFNKNGSSKGPGTKGHVPFYNPSMELNRDLSILVNQWLINASKRPVHLLDGLAASGIRGIRLANELDGNFQVTINDWDEEASRLITKNVEYHKLTNVTTSKKNLNTLLSEHKFDYIDIDPFGSPIYFIDAAMRSIHHNGIIACTATDTATLCGVYPKVCVRRYGAQPFHSPVMHEIGLRILLGVLCREASKYDKGIKPVLSYATDHYCRIYVRVKNRVSYANTSISHFSTISSKELDVFSDDQEITVGPLWTGKLQHKRIIQALRTMLFDKQLQTKHEILKLLDVLEEEANAPPFFYTTENVASVLKLSPPRMETIFDKLKNKGYDVFRTHYSPTGFKTNAPRDEIEAIFMQQK
jgi:tRNA (guanine26-N2/guanine27-N2)-dimethyltransferase